MPAEVQELAWPQPEWFKKWKETLFLPNIKACITHTYNKAMAFRNQLIEEDGSYSTNQIVNIDEDQVRFEELMMIVGNLLAAILFEGASPNYA